MVAVGSYPQYLEDQNTFLTRVTFEGKKANVIKCKEKFLDFFSLMVG